MNNSSARITTASLSTSSWSTSSWSSTREITTRHQSLSGFNPAVDVIYGFIVFMCFLIGTTGNMVSFLYFKRQKKDVSNFLYMLITANDILISITVLPVGISLWSRRRPGILFGSEIGCAAWCYVWKIGVDLSIFFVICLGIMRTTSLLRPFKQQQRKYLVMAVITYLAIRLSVAIVVHIKQEGMRVVFNPDVTRCVFNAPIWDKTLLLIWNIIDLLFHITPPMVVATSCVISAVLLLRTNQQVRQTELQKSRNRATLTILLFALLYGVCNVPANVVFVIATYAHHSGNYEWFVNLSSFDKQQYFMVAICTLLLALNSAANPILYFWRMSGLRDFIRGISRLNREIIRIRMRPNNANQLEWGPEIGDAEINNNLYLPRAATILSTYITEETFL